MPIDNALCSFLDLLVIQDIMISSDHQLVVARNCVEAKINDSPLRAR